MSDSITDAAEAARSDRLVAFLVDFALLSTVAFVLWLVSFGVNTALSLGVSSGLDSGAAAGPTGSIVLTSLIGLVVNFALWIAISALLVWYFAFYGDHGETVGKSMRDLIVVGDDGAAPSERQIQKRTAVLLAPLPVMVLLGGLLGGLGFVLGLFLMTGWLVIEAAAMLVSDDGQRLGDSLADTYVVADTR